MTHVCVLVMTSYGYGIRNGQTILKYETLTTS